MKRWIGWAWVWALAAACAAGCDGDGKHGRVPLLVEDFSTFPSATWAAQQGGDPTQDLAVGNPAPSLRLTQGGLRYVGNPFANSNPQTTLLIGIDGSVEVRVDPAQIPAGASVTATFAIRDQNDPAANNAVVAIQFEASAGGTVTGDATYSIAAGGGTSASAPDVPFNVDSGFHSFRFSIDDKGTARWRRDGILQATATGFPAADLFLELGAATAATTTAVPVHFDNVIVTSP